MATNVKWKPFIDHLVKLGYAKSTVDAVQRWIDRILLLKEKEPGINYAEAFKILSCSISNPDYRDKIHWIFRIVKAYEEEQQLPKVRKPNYKDDSFGELPQSVKEKWQAFLQGLRNGGMSEHTLWRVRLILCSILQKKVEKPDKTYEELLYDVADSHLSYNYCRKVCRIIRQMQAFEDTGKLPLKHKHVNQRPDRFLSLPDTVRHKWASLFKGMNDNGYSNEVIRNIRYWIVRVEQMRESTPQMTFEDMYELFKRGKTTTTLRNVRYYLSILWSYETRDKNPDRTRSDFMMVHRETLLCPAFHDIISTYKRVSVNLRCSKKYTKSCSDVAVRIFAKLQNMGVTSISSITEPCMIEIFRNYTDPTIPNTFKQVLRTVSSNDYNEECRRIIAICPCKRKKRPNIQRLTKEEISKIKAILTGQHPNQLSLRDKAIGVLAMFTGMRRCDIVTLRLADIDWKHEVISIIQQKTKRPLVLPLRPIVGNALYEYIMFERPKCEAKEVFLSTVHPHVVNIKKLMPQSLYDISVKIFKAAGIRMGKARKGFHLFRHNLAVSLLENEVTLPVISETLGHSSPASINAYLGADMKHLKECSLSIEEFPIRKGVFHD